MNEELEALRAQVLSLTKERDLLLEKGAATFRLDMAELRKQLTASQAREAKLRLAAEAFSRARKHAQDYGHLEEANEDIAEAYYHADNMNDEALALPTDTTALDERLAQERDRFAEQIIERFAICKTGSYADEIRSMK